MTERTDPEEGTEATGVPPTREGPDLRSDGGGGSRRGLFGATPAPTVSYAVADGVVHVTEMNAAYAETFDVDGDASGPLEARLRADLQDDGPAAVENIVDLVAEATDGEDRRTVVRASTPQGERDYLSQVAPGPDGEEGYLVLTDITPLRERTRELAEQRDRLDEFASIVSHDLRNPLEVAEIQLEAGRTREGDDHFAKVEDAHERMERIIEDVLTLARQGQVIEGIGESRLGSVARDAWGSVSAPEVELRVADDATLGADGARLRTLLENLFRNADEHGGPAVTVEVGLADDGFYVADDGPGIPEEDRDRVFEGGYSTNADGTGLGLVIVERIAKAHGWTVTVTTSKWGGARFEFAGVDVER